MPNPGKDSASPRSKDDSPTETLFSKHVLLQSKGRAQTMLSKIRDLLAARGVKVADAASSGEIWGKVAHFDEHHGRAQVFSLVVHGGLGLALFLTIALQMPPSITPIANFHRVFMPDPGELRMPKKEPVAEPGKGHGSGGEQNPLPIPTGNIPPSSLREQIVPPSVIRNRNAIYQEIPTIEGPEQFRKLDLTRMWGDPRSPYDYDSNGSGTGPGMGTEKGRGGIGNRNGSRYGDDLEEGFARRVYSDGEGVRSPQCVYCPRPDYSDEARKAKYQCSVVLSVVVLPDGKTSRIEVISSPGLGLDLQAIEAVRSWRFRPGWGPNGKPAAIAVTIEVIFQLF